MLEKVRIRFYQINDCGYYMKNSVKPEFGAIDNILPQLKNWIEQPNITLSSTSTYSATNVDGPMRTFCLGVKPCGLDDFLVVTWNEIPTSDGKVASIDVTGPVSKPNIDETEIQDGYIPGYASYFFFIPKSNQYATIQFHNPLNGNQNLQHYINGFLKIHPTYSVHENQGNDFTLKGYAENPGLISNKSKIPFLYPKFRSSLFVRGGMVDYIINNVTRISKLISKFEISIEEKHKFKIFQSWMEAFKISNPNKTYNKTFMFRSEVNFEPTISELEQIINEWQSMQKTEQEDIGFEFSKENEIYWLSHSIVSFEQEINVGRENSQLVNMESLSAWLVNNKESLVSKTKKDSCKKLD